MTQTSVDAAPPGTSRVGGSGALLLSGLARVAGFLPTAIALLVTSRLIISHYGVRTFDSFSLMLALMTILPLNSLGLGAAVTSAYAEDGPASERARRVSLTALRALTGATVVLAAVALALSAAGLWPRVIGDASGPNLFVGLGVVVYAASFVPGLAPSMLLGANRNHVTVAIQSFFAPATLAWVLVVLLADLDGRWLVVAAPAAALTIQLVTAGVVRRVGVRWGPLVRQVPWPRRYPGGRIRELSGPMFLATLALPIALQSDRIVLSHVSSVRAVANYSVAFQIFAPVAAVAAAAAQPLWPIHAKARAEGRRGPSLPKLTALFGIGAVLVCAVLVAVANPLGRLVGGPDMKLGVLLPLAAAAMVVVQALVSPLAMTLVDPGGLRVVAVVNLVALPINLTLSVLLAYPYDAAGPLLATAIVFFTVQFLPLAVYARNRASVGRHRLLR
jgi:O-antigen/teichoic acid export membrane protein